MLDLAQLLHVYTSFKYVNMWDPFFGWSRFNSSRTLCQSSETDSRFTHSLLRVASSSSCQTGEPCFSNSPLREHHKRSISRSRCEIFSLEISTCSATMQKVQLPNTLGQRQSNAVLIIPHPLCAFCECVYVGLPFFYWLRSRLERSLKSCFAKIDSLSEIKIESRLIFPATKNHAHLSCHHVCLAGAGRHHLHSKAEPPW